MEEKIKNDNALVSPASNKAHNAKLILLLTISLIVITVSSIGCGKSASEALDESTAETAVETTIEESEKNLSSHNEKETESVKSDDESVTASSSDDILLANNRSEHVHRYSSTVIDATCTEQGYTLYQCSCGDSYMDDYVAASHNYKNLICSICGEKAPNYADYKSELDSLDAAYQEIYADIHNKLAVAESTLYEVNQNLTDVRSELMQLPSYCPDWFMRDYIANWHAYGSTAAATQAADADWRAEYKRQKSNLESAITNLTNHAARLENDIADYQQQFYWLDDEYSSLVEKLNEEYGIK